MERTLRKGISEGIQIMKVICIVAAIIYLIGTVGAYEQCEISTAKFLVRAGLSFLMMILA